ncbi:hypothetical protein EJ08DRAFT_416372 [Tothia fuscella]|uniref:Zn(2)-C6 fungal-type domain-containing protein n=1 Tax=Tothia fuscella TaxID=1048955 RepID=A0A9P4NJX3_9PEZI|nr:hypothetical protein EJ08DRAFT_416372 [Tothia fuscella]
MIMVGVSGKSKACHDCKRRRVKCDFGRPGCLRCQKAKISCHGYEKTTLFVNRTPTTLSTTAQSAMSELRQRKLPNPTTQDARTLTPASSQWDGFLQKLKLYISNPSYSRSGYRNETSVLVRELYLPKPTAPNSSVSLGSMSPYHWFQAVCELRGTSDALDHALLAFCSILVSTSRSGCEPPSEGLLLYQRGLQTLVKDLEDRQIRNNDETLAAIVVLSTCELFAAPDDQGWSAHANGISSLLHERSTPDNPPALWLSLCSRLRIICVLIGLTKRQELIPADKWRQLMPKKHTTESFEGLMDLISDIPLLLQEAEAIGVGDRGHCPTRGILLIPLLIDAVQRLNKWQQDCVRQSPKPPYQTVPSTTENPADIPFGAKLFPIALEYESLNAAMPLILNSGVMLQILGLILRLDAKIGFLDKQEESEVPYQTKQKYTSVPSITAEADRLARTLCESVEYCHRVEMRILGPQATCYTQWVTRSYFRRAKLEREVDWVNNIQNMTGLGSRCGIELMPFGSDESIL